MRIEIPGYIVFIVFCLAFYNFILCAAVVFCNIYMALHPLETTDKRIDLYLDFWLLQAALSFISNNIPYEITEKKTPVGSIAFKLRRWSNLQRRLLLHLPLGLIYFYSSIQPPMPPFCTITYKALSYSVWAILGLTIVFAWDNFWNFALDK